MNFGVKILLTPFGRFLIISLDMLIIKYVAIKLGKHQNQSTHNTCVFVFVMNGSAGELLPLTYRWFYSQCTKVNIYDFRLK